MAGSGGNGSVPSSLPPPQPKSPPQYPDLYGKRRESAKVQMLEREIGFLEEELKSIEGLNPASRACKEVVDFVMANADPLLPSIKKTHKSRRFWKWLCRVSCLNLSWIFCCSCMPHLELPRCCHCNCDGDCNACESCSKLCCCRMPKCHCFSCWNCECFSKPKCSSTDCCSCCTTKCPSCSCKRCCTCYSKCLKLNICSCCHNIFCYPCYFCY